MDRTLALIADYATSLRYDDLPASAVRAAKQKLVDALGCALGAYAAEPCAIARRLCFATASPLTARVIGSLARTTPEMAAFANAVMVRYLDFNDSYRFKDAGHPSDAIPAVLAVAEAVRADGRQLITAIALAYEMQVRIIEEVPLDHRGWDQPVYVVLGSAVGAGKLLGLTPDQMAHAAALAVVPNIALYQNRIGELSMWKAGAAGMAARQGIFAALLAREGLTGPGEAIEGKHGLMSQVTGPFGLEPLGRQGQQFGVERPNLKTYPVRDSCQLIVRTALELREKVRPEEIAALEVQIYASMYRTAVESPELWAPKTRETADHSAPFSLAAALLDGDVTPETFSRARFRDPDVLALIGRMRIAENPEFTKQTPGKRNCRIEARTHRGETAVVHKIFTAEELQRPWTGDQVEAKFRRLVDGVLSPARTQASLDILWRLEDLGDAAALLDQLRVEDA